MRDARSRRSFNVPPRLEEEDEEGDGAAAGDRSGRPTRRPSQSPGDTQRMSGYAGQATASCSNTCCSPDLTTLASWRAGAALAFTQTDTQRGTGVNPSE